MGQVRVRLGLKLLRRGTELTSTESVTYIMSDDTNSDWTTIKHGRNDVLNDSEIIPNLSMCVQSCLSFIQIKRKVQEENIYAN